jgi:5-methylcytosine-specific restriction protein B
LIEKWQGDYKSKTEEELFGQYYPQYRDILSKMDSLCDEARELLAKLKNGEKTTVIKNKTIADKIRLFVIENYIEPAREKNKSVVTFRSGEVHSRMKLNGNHANVCQVLRGKMLHDLAGIRLLEENGPKMGGRTYFKYQVEKS